MRTIASAAIKKTALLQAHAVLNQLNVQHWLSCGILLGYYRENNFIEHDPDIDLGIWAHDYRPEFSQAFSNAGFKVILHGNPTQGYPFAAHKGVKVDIFLHNKVKTAKGNKVVLPLHSIRRRHKPMQYVYSPFRLIPITFMGADFLVPSNPGRMIREHYGPGWQIPIKDWKYDCSPANVDKDGPADYWDTVYEGMDTLDPSQFAQYCLTQQFIQGTVFDMGCGSGRDSLFFEPYADKVIACDQSEIAIRQLRQRDTDIRWMYDDITHLHRPELNGKIDVVYSRFVLHSVNKLGQERALNCAYNLLKPGGKLLIETRTNDDPHHGIGIKLSDNEFVVDGAHYRRFIRPTDILKDIKYNNMKVVDWGVSTGWAPTATEDPKVLRIIAEKPMKYTAKDKSMELHKSWHKNITIGIKTYERPEHTRRLIASIRHFYPDIPIVVADDSAVVKEQRSELLNWYILPYDSGLSVGRNFIVDRANTPYVLILDDDFLFCANTELEKMYTHLEKHNADIVTGRVINVSDKLTSTPKHNVRPLESMLCINEDTLHMYPVKPSQTDPFKCDYGYNFIMARTDTLRQVRWDPDLKLAEHTDFFIRVKQAGLTVHCHPSVVIRHDHTTPNTTEYKMNRRHKWCIGFYDLMKKHNLKYAYDRNGKKRDIETMRKSAARSKAILQSTVPAHKQRTNGTNMKVPQRGKKGRPRIVNTKREHVKHIRKRKHSYIKY